MHASFILIPPTRRGRFRREVPLRFKDDETRLVADVDCTAGGKALCDQVPGCLAAATEQYAAKFRRLVLGCIEAKFWK